MPSRTILIVNPGADVYGSDLQMLQSVAALAERGYRVVVVLPARGPLVRLVESRGGRCVHVDFPVIRRSALSARGMATLAVDVLRSAPAVVRTLRTFRPAVVYVNTTTIPWWIAAARVMQVPVLCHVHEAEDQGSAAVLRALSAPLLLPNRVVLNSRTAAETLWEHFPRARRRSAVILNGLPDRPTPPVGAPGDQAAPRLAVVGRLSPRKGTHVAVEALGLLVADGLDAHLEIAGSVFPGYEWYESQLRERVEILGLADRVSFSGYVNPPHDVYDRADVVLAPSTRESLGNVVIEAQLAQRPVVATASSGHLESVVHEQTGVLVPVGDASAMAEAVRRLVASPELRTAMGERARRSAQDLFGVGRYGQQITAVVDALETSGGHPATVLSQDGP